MASTSPAATSKGSGAVAVDIRWDDIEVLTFDVGSTLIYPYPSVGEIYARSMARFGLQAAPAAIEAAFQDAWNAAQARPRASLDAHQEWAWWRDLVAQVVERLGRPPQLDFEALFEELWDVFARPEVWRLFDGVEPVLAAAAGRGLRLGVLSNWDLRLRPLLHDLGLAARFEHLVISAEVGVEKPDRGIFREAERRFGAGPAAFVHVGDSHKHDVRGAQAAGWQAIAVNGEPGHKGNIGPVRELLQHLPEG